MANIESDQAMLSNMIQANDAAISSASAAITPLVNQVTQLLNDADNLEDAVNGLSDDTMDNLSDAQSLASSIDGWVDEWKKQEVKADIFHVNDSQIVAGSATQTIPKSCLTNVVDDDEVVEFFFSGTFDPRGNALNEVLSVRLMRNGSPIA